MPKKPRVRVWSIALLCLGVLAAGAPAQTVGYWRMEEDLTPDDDATWVVPNEVTGENLTYTNAVPSTEVPLAEIPQTGAPNTQSADTVGSGGGAGLDGTIPAYDALNTDSITVEFWARTNEGTADLVTRSTDANGFAITDPDGIDLVYYVSDGDAGVEEVSLTDVTSLDGLGWAHLAFTYNAATGVGQLFLDGTQVALNDGPDNRPLVWDTGAPVLVGVALDGGGVDGNLDELRISGEALPVSSFLNIPEPATMALLGLGGLALLRRRR